MSHDLVASEGVTAGRITWALPHWLRGLLVVALVSGVLALLVLGWQRTGSSVVILIDGHRSEVRTHATTVGEVLHEAGLDLYPEDWVQPGLQAALTPGLVVDVRRAWPVKLHVDGQTRQLRTHATTVGALLAEAGVQTGPGDELWLGEQLVGTDALLGGNVSDSRVMSHRGGQRIQPEVVALDPPLLSLRRAATLTLVDGGITQTLHTTTETVGQALQEIGISLFLGDRVEPGLQQRVAPGMTVTIERSVPVRILVDGRVIRTRTRAGTVAGVLGQEGVALVGKDRAEPDLAAPIVPNMTVRITRVQEALVVEFDPILFTTIWVADPELEIDHQRLVQEGQIGLTKHRYRVVYENGQEIERFLEDTWAEQPPITKTLAYGTKIIVRTLDTPDGPVEYWRKIRVYTTSYRPASCGKPKSDPRYGYTRLGWKLRRGIVAVDPTVIPLRTKMYVPGYGLAQAGDTGGGVKGKLVDLGFSDNDYESWHWWTDIYILTPVPPASRIRWVLPNWPKFPDRRR
jgi:uncharacterized protein YabE (DUF348 family)